MQTTITTSKKHSYSNGDMIAVTMLDRRWWKRLLYFVTLRSAPTKTEHFKISAVSETTFMEFDGEYNNPIPEIPDKYLTWAGKDAGKQKPNIIWID